MEFVLIHIACLLILAIEARRYNHFKQPSINNFEPHELKEALTIGRIPQSVANQILSILPLTNDSESFLDKQDKIDKILLASLPDNLLDAMLQLQPNALPPWLVKLPQNLQKRIKDVNRDKQKTWAHKLVELEMINLKIVQSSEDSQYSMNGTGQSDYKLGPLSVVPCLNPAASSNTPSKISLYTNSATLKNIEGGTKEGTINQVPMCLNQSGYYPFADGLKTLFSSEECYNCTVKTM